MASNKKSNKSQKPAVKNLAPKDEATVKAGRKAGGTQHEYLTLTLTDVMVSGYN